LQRRAVLAAALLADPDLLLLDEPTVGLDPVAAHDVHAFLRDSIQQTGRTTLLCTHNLAEAEALCQEVIILRDGRVLVHAPLAELRRRARPQVRLEARQEQATLVDALRRRELDARPEPEGRGVLVALDHAPAHVPDLLRGLLADGVDVFACQPLQPTLESLFLDVVRGAT
jgi:ABC-2 type transport system ATP-binding protein